MRKALALATTTAAVLALAVTASPATAAEGTTTVALTVEDGELAITTTAAATGVSSQLVGTGRVLTSPLGLTTVTDTRSGSTGWTLSARTTLFTHSNTTSTIPASAASFYVSAAPTKVLGTVSYTSTTTPSTSGTLVVAAASGVNTSEVSPVLRVDVPSTAITGLYTGTVTQSVV